MFRPAFPRFVQLQERVKSLFYSYGLFCATHQLSTILFAVISVLFVIYPLRNIPILGNTSQMYEMPLSDYNVGEKSSASPRWYSGPPIGYVQQILVKSTVAPSHPYKAPTLADLYTAPLHTSFTILEQINRLQVGDGTSGKKLTISDVCLHVSEPDANVQGSRFLPQFDCLILSPANLWHNQKEVFESDKEILQTVQSSAQNSYEASPRMRDLLFGVPWRESGMSKFFVRNRERTVQYSITIIYKTYNPEYIKQLTDTLLSLYPLSLVNSNVSQTITHVSYREHTTSYIADYTPLIAAYLILFLYIYFSVQKIEMVKSKWGLAFSAVITVVCSLLMSISICAVFGVTPSVNSGEIFPYLVVIVGLENVLVVTRSVVSTPLNLEVKFRIAEGLRMEGWNITKHLMTELVILAFGFLTFVPAIQEFCLFASIGLLVDFYLQMFFFATVLSIDIRRLELSDLGRGHTYLHVQSDTGRVLADDASTTVQPDLNPSPAESDTFIVASLFHIPKRIKVMNFVAQFRVVQRLMMLCTVIWISLVLYKTGIISSIISQVTLYSQNTPTPPPYFNTNHTRLPDSVKDILNNPDMRPLAAKVIDQDVNSEENWKKVSFMHWPAVFSLYNKSIVGTYITFLPSVKLSLIITAEQASHLKSQSQMFDDPNYEYSSVEDVEDFDLVSPSNSSFLHFIYTKAAILQALSGTEKILLGLVILTTLVLLFWFISYLYSIMCRKDYAKWRKSSSKYSLASRLPRYQEILSDETSLYMTGLSQPIECLVCSSDSIVCSDLAGDIITWNCSTGETLSQIDRSCLPLFSSNADDDSKLYRQQSSGDSPRNGEYNKCSFLGKSRDVASFDLAPFVSTQFTSMQKRSFPECLRDIEQERVNQCNMMASAHENIDYKGRSLSPQGEGPLHFYSSPNIWCLDFNDGLIVAGCSDGSIEFWDSSNGVLKHRYPSSHIDSGIASIKTFGNRVIAGRTDGYLDFIEICYSLSMAKTEEGGVHPGPYRGHRRIRSLGTNTSWRHMDMHCNTLHSVKAHQSTIGLLAIASGRCLTACEDKIINVYRSDDANLLYTLRGHNDTIILLQADEQTATAQTASEDGVIRLWDLLTGACIHKLTGLIGPVLNLQISSNYVIASSLESLMCIWDKSSGRLVHSIHKSNCSYSGAITVLVDTLLVSGGRDTLYFWDLESGSLIYSIKLPTTNCMDGINKLTVMNSCTLVATVGSQVHTITFRKIAERIM